MPLLNLSFGSGESSLSVRRFSVHEAISSLFTASVWARSPDQSIDLAALVGQPAVFEVGSGYVNTLFDSARVFTGIVSFIEQVQGEASDLGLSTYYLRIVPRLWILTQRRNHRIFQHLSIPDIVDQLLTSWGVEYTWNIDRGAYPKLEYKVQYRETDYVFFTRLLEEAGIAFFFDDSDGKISRLVLGDALHKGQKRSGPPIHYVDNPSQAAEREFVTAVHLAHEVRPGAHTIRDVDFRKPAFPLFGGSAAAFAPEARYEQYRYQPGAFLIEGGRGGGTPTADDQGIARHEQPYGKSREERALLGDRMGKKGVTFGANVVDLRPGTIFSIDNHGHPELAAAEDLLVTSFTIEGSPEGEWGMAGHAVFTETEYRPPLATPRPRVHGVQTATVVGPQDQEIYTDEFGRVRVQFPWDREGTDDEHSSCWIRVNQGWGGKGYGMMLIPRIGQEVLIGFLEGDPDRPILVGRLYNQTNPVPYKLPDHKTVSTWKSNSSIGGQGSNEVRYEDKTGEELVYLQAEKNLRELVKHDETITVLNDRDKHVIINETDTTGVNRTEVTGINRHEMTWSHRTTFIVGNKAKVIKLNETERTDGNRRLRVGKDLHHVVKGKKRELVQEDVHLHVVGKRSERIDGTQSLTLLHDQFEFVEGSYALSAGKDIHFNALEKLIGEAADVTFKGPGGFIRINASGVTIHGTVVEINVGGSSGQGRGSKPELPELPNEARVPIPIQPDGKEEQQFLSERQNLGVNASGRGKRKKRGPGAMEAPPFSRVYKSHPSVADLITDPRIDHDLKQAWGESRPNAAAVPRGTPGSVKQKQGGWVVWDKKSGHVATVRAPAGSRDGLGTITGTRPADTADHHVVAWFQTQPNVAAEGYASGPSPADVGWQNAHGKAPGIVETHDGRRVIPYP
jgi:type VI secretion system secreted protein VgrG